jgi:hypothetical protein
MLVSSGRFDEYVHENFPRLGTLLGQGPSPYHDEGLSGDGLWHCQFACKCRVRVSNARS